MMLASKLFEMPKLGLLDFRDEQTNEVAFGGMSLAESALLSRQSKGMAVVPVFGRPHKTEEKLHVFVLMPFKAKLEKVYTNHIKRAVEELGLNIRRAEEIFRRGPLWRKSGKVSARRN